MDYRFMPEPDLAPLIITDALIQRAQASLPELPNETIDRITKTYALSSATAATLVNMNEGDNSSIAFFQQTVVNAVNALEKDGSGTGGNYANDNNLDSKNKELYRKMAKPVANWILNDLSGLLHKASSSGPSSDMKKATSKFTISAEALGELIALVEGGKLSGKRGKAILVYLVTGDDTDVRQVNNKNINNKNNNDVSSVPSRSLSPREIALANGWISTSTTNTISNGDSDVSRGGGGDDSNKSGIEQDKEDSNNLTRLRQVIILHAEALVNDPAHIESVNKWRVRGSDRVHSALVKILLETYRECASHPRLAAECMKDALGPLGQREEKPMGRKAARKMAAEEAAAAAAAAGGGKSS